jgi:hypothetical protein
VGVCVNRIGTIQGTGSSSGPFDVLVAAPSNLINSGTEVSNVIECLQVRHYTYGIGRWAPETSYTTGHYYAPATFRVSLDGGTTYGSTISTIPGSTFSYVIPGTGYTLLLTNPAFGWTANEVIQPYPPVTISGAPNSEYISGQGIGPVTASGTSPPTVQMLGSPASNSYSMLIEITTGGSSSGGGVVFKWSSNGGTTFLPPAGGSGVSVPTNPSTGVTLGSAGVIAYFATGTYSANNTYSALTSGIAIDIMIFTPGALGTMQFQVSLNGTNSYHLNQTWGPVQSTTAVSTYSYIIPGTGLTVNFGSGYYSAGDYTSPSFGWSMTPGTTIIDGGVTWEVVIGTACITDLGGSQVNIRRVLCQGGIAGVILDQAESCDLEACYFSEQTLAGLWICGNGDHTPGAQGGFTNAIYVRDKCQFATGGNAYGIVDDGGATHCISNTLFEGNSAGWAYFAAVVGVNISGIYIEDPGGLARNLAHCSRRMLSIAAFGFNISGSGCGIIGGGLNGGISVLDFSGVCNGFSASGNQLDGFSIAGFTGISGASSFSGAGNSGRPFEQVSIPTIQDIISGPYKDIQPPGADVAMVAFAPLGAFSISGFTQGVDGAAFTLINPSGCTMTLNHLDPFETTKANQIVCPAGVDLVLPCGSGGFSWARLMFVTAESVIWPEALPHWLVVGHSALPAPALQITQAQSAASVPEFVLGRLTGTGTILGVYYVPSAASTPAAGSNNQALTVHRYQANGASIGSVATTPLANATPMTKFADFSLGAISNAAYADGDVLTAQTSLTGTPTLPQGTWVVVTLPG